MRAFCPRELVFAGLIGFALVASPAMASGGGEHASEPAAGQSESGDKKSADDGNNIALPTLIVPVLKSQKLVGYVYVGVKLSAKGSSEVNHLRDILPLIQDALLRAFNDLPLGVADTDSPASRLAVTKTATGALERLGEGEKIQTIVVTDYQTVLF